MSATALALEPAEHGPAAEHSDATHISVRRRLAERAISLRGMPSSLRLVVGIAFAQLLATAALVVLRDAPWPSINAATSDNHLLAMPAAVFWVSVAFLVLAWSYVLAAALHASLPVRVLGLAAFTAAHWQMLEIAGFDRPLWMVAVAAVALVWLVGAAIWLGEVRGLRKPPHATQFDLRIAVLALAPTLAVYAAAYWSEHAFTTLNFAMGVTLELEDLSWLLIPMLFLAGADFADWGDLVGTRLARVSAFARRPYLLAAATGIIALGVLVAEGPGLMPQLLPETAGAVIAAGWVIVLLWRARVGPHWPAHVPTRAVVLAGLSYMAVVSGLVVVPTLPTYFARVREIGQSPPVGGRLTGYSRVEQPAFSLDYPSLWAVRPFSQGEAAGSVAYVVFDGTADGDPAQMWVLGVPLQTAEREAGDPGELLEAWLRSSARGYMLSLGPASTTGDWTERSYALQESEDTPPLEGTAWQKTDGDVVWILGATRPAQWQVRYDPLFTTMLASWRPEASEAETQSGSESGASATTVSAGSGVLWLAVAAVAGWLTLRRRPGSPAGLGWLYVSALGLLAGLAYAPSIAHALGVAPPQVPYVRLEGVRVLVAVGTLAVLGTLLARRALASQATVVVHLLVLNVALQVVAWTVALYTTTSDLGGRFTVAQAVILILAGLWDVAMSGEAITNLHGRFFPRHTRVLLFLGYEMLVATAILYFSSFQVQSTGASVADTFESDTWPRLGVVFLGMPLVLVLAGVRLGAAWARTRAALPPVDAPDQASSRSGALAGEAGMVELQTGPQRL